MIENLINSAAEKLNLADSAYWLDDELPWRKNVTPYKVFIAEFLLIRTRTDSVKNIYGQFVEKFPSIQAIRQADIKLLERELYSLGMKKRVRLLKESANIIFKKHNGIIPTNVSSLKSLPGIGDYTAKAIANIAFGDDKVPGDVNILRFISRISGLQMFHPTKGSKELRNLLPLLAQKNGGPNLNSLIDFCRKICTGKKPKCEECPLTNLCNYYAKVSL